MLFRCGRPGAEGEGESSSRSGRGQKVSEHGGDHDYYLFFQFSFFRGEFSLILHCKKEHTLSRHWKTGNLWSHKSNKLEKNLVCEEENEVLTLALGFLNYFFFKLFLQLYVNRLIISKKNNPQLPNKVDISFSAKLHRNTD